MKQVTQRLRDGRIEVLEVPEPALTPENVLISVRASLLSAGTERAKVETGRQSLIGKARSRPDDVQQVLGKVRTDGLRATVATVKARLEQPSSLGYSASGVVLAVGARVRDLAPGDRVACGGADYAVHAEVVSVPGNLCVRLPGNVGFDEGAFATVGAIALHGVRQADIRLGERVGVIGLGLVGQLAGLLLRAAGATVVGVDLGEDACTRARELGSVDFAFARDRLGTALPEEATECDAVILTAATRSDDPVRLAARLCRDRGRVVVVGDVGMDVPRAAYYDKELDLRLSRSYGPGRYDRTYEERGIDYPLGYVRWTERRNMAAFVGLLGSGRIDVQGVIGDRIPVADAPDAYEALIASAASPLGIVLRYEDQPASGRPTAPRVAATPEGARTGFGIIGAGSFAQRILIPAFTAAGFQPEAVASQAGLSAATVAEHFGFRRACSPEDVVGDPATRVVVIATRHNSHADLAIASLREGKAVFVEKPPALTLGELDSLQDTRDVAPAPLAVGFNRRHAPAVSRALAYLGAGPKEVVIRVNARALPPDHWLNDAVEGGGRLIGEGCHFVDLACWIVGSAAESVGCVVRREPGQPLALAQSFVVSLRFSDGSIASVSYCSEGSQRLPKERIEIHAAGKSAVIDDFKRLELYGEGRRRGGRASRQDKGHAAQVLFFKRLIDGTATSTLDPLLTMRATLYAALAAEHGTTVSLDLGEGRA